MRKLILAFLLASATPALAQLQGGVQQSGSVTAGNVATWSRNGVIQDGGATPGVSCATPGTSGGIPYYSSTTTCLSSGLLAANALVIGGGAGTTPSTTTTGTGVLTALGNSVGSAGAFVTNGGALGTPSSGVITNLTGTCTACFAWTTFTITATSTGGVLGTYNTVNARYMQVGKLVTVHMTFYLTSAGTAPTGDVLVAAPVAPNNLGGGSAGNAYGVDQATGVWLGGLVDGTNIRLSFTNGISATANGTNFAVTAVYEAL